MQPTFTRPFNRPNGEGQMPLNRNCWEKLPAKTDLGEATTLYLAEMDDGVTRVMLKCVLSVVLFLRSSIKEATSILGIRQA